MGGKRVFIIMGGKRVLIIVGWKRVLIIVGGKRVSTIVGGKRVYIIVGGKRVFYCGRERCFLGSDGNRAGGNGVAAIENVYLLTIPKMTNLKKEKFL